MIKRDNIYLSIAAAFIVTPATFMLALFWLTNDPTLRPLGVTQAKLASAGMVEQSGAILTTVAVGPGAELPVPRERFEREINKAFDVYRLQSRFRYVQSGVSRAQITFSVGKSRIGTYSYKTAAEGIRPTANAYKMVTAHNKQVAINQQRNLNWVQRIFAE